jgi:hypothetical protein
MELRCQREVIQRWLSSDVLPDGVRVGLRSMLAEVEEQLTLLTNAPR